MLKINNIGETTFPHEDYWPPVNAFQRFDPSHAELLSMSPRQREDYITNLSAVDRDQHVAVTMGALSTIYAHYFGYIDGPCHLGLSDEEEVELFQLKLLLENEFLTTILASKQAVPQEATASVAAACEYLEQFVVTNAGVEHRFFEFAKNQMTLAQWQEFLLIEVVRNEVVDDEVALMVPGLQHAMKQVMASNLWDECGNGHIDRFHTNWLRRLLTTMGAWDRLLQYRSHKPWFTGLTSNSLNLLLTRPGKSYAAYGHFLVTEGWVCPHFEKMVQGMERVGLTDDEVQIYFDMHIKIDPHHTQEMIAGIRQMQPPPTQKQLQGILTGAHQAAAAGSLMYDELLHYFAEQR